MLELREIEKTFDGKPVLRSISLTVATGEVVALLGPSGSGKTTLLRIIAGLETADSGQLLLAGGDLTQIPVHERGFGMVFQDYALFPHKNVAQNVAFGLRMSGWKEGRRAARVDYILRLVGLVGFGNRPVYELSGGEQQRVALARALAPAPRLLLLDEPLGALDRALRERLMGELREILQEAEGARHDAEGITAIYVTHDQGEAFAIADRVVVMHEGCIEQVDTPVELYRHPETPFVARFIGMENLLDAKVITGARPMVRTALGLLRVSQPNAVVTSQIERGTPILLLVRPDAARQVTPGTEAANVVTGRLVGCSFRGRYQKATLATGDNVVLKLEFEAGDELPSVGGELTVALDPEGLILLTSPSE